jgi:hypothetical protein
MYVESVKRFDIVDSRSIFFVDSRLRILIGCDLMLGDNDC